jgi:hypothetical protein
VDRSGAVLKAPGFVAGFDDVAVVSEAVEQRRRHFGVVERARPFAERQVGGDYDRCLLVEAAELSGDQQVVQPWTHPIGKEQHSDRSLHAATTPGG